MNTNLERPQVSIQLLNNTKLNKSTWENNLLVIIAFFTSLNSFDYGIKEKFPQNMTIHSCLLKVTS